jgi:hypothetical protein
MDSILALLALNGMNLKSNQIDPILFLQSGAIP